MLLSDPSIRPIEVYTFTPADYAIGFLAMLVLLLTAMSAVAWVMSSPADGGQPDEDAVESAETVELPRRSGPRSTGTVCAPGYRRDAADDPTVVIDTRRVSR
jgi:hypothetical protein